jgi:hypothetical protein
MTVAVIMPPSECPPEVRVLRRAVLLHEVAPQVLDVLDGVLHVPAGRAERRDGRGGTGRKEIQHPGPQHRIGLREIVRDGPNDALVSRVAVRVQEQVAVPVLRHLDERVRALDLDVLHLLGKPLHAGEREDGSDQRRADHDGAARVTCRPAL